MSDQESGSQPGDPEEVKIQKHMVRVTADLLEAAAEVIHELGKRDGKEFGTEEPSMMEMVGIANLIITGKISGIYEVKKEEPRKSILDPGSLYKLVESMVRLELLKQQRPMSSVPPRAEFPPPPSHLTEGFPPPPPPPPPAPRSRAEPVCQKCQGPARFIPDSGGTISCLRCDQ